MAIFAVGVHLNNLEVADKGFKTRECNLFVRGYLNNKTLGVLTGAGILIGGAGVLAFLMSAGHLTSLAALVHAGSFSSHTLMIAGVAGMAAGGSVALTHGTIIGLRQYALREIRANSPERSHKKIKQ